MENTEYSYNDFVVNPEYHGKSESFFKQNGTENEQQSAVDQVYEDPLTQFYRQNQTENSYFKRLRREWVAMTLNPPKNIFAAPKGQSIREWEAYIMGPLGSPYANGIFELEIIFPTDYPFSAPDLTLKTKIYHCNISETGMVCLDVLDDWTPSVRIDRVLNNVFNLFFETNPYKPLNPKVAQHFLQNREGHDAAAREWTAKFAVFQKDSKDVFGVSRQCINN